ncbi:MAG: hypothetical protein HQK58_13685, partial [Deltaproteobacteria bacterium]|nr:hypothetical protein [Deltaproteobacteria bacterium]
MIAGFTFRQVIASGMSVLVSGAIPVSASFLVTSQICEPVTGGVQWLSVMSGVAAHGAWIESHEIASVDRQQMGVLVRSEIGEVGQVFLSVAASTFDQPEVSGAALICPMATYDIRLDGKSIKNLVPGASLKCSLDSVHNSFDLTST